MLRHAPNYRGMAEGGGYVTRANSTKTRAPDRGCGLTGAIIAAKPIAI